MQVKRFGTKHVFHLYKKESGTIPVLVDDVEDSVVEEPALAGNKQEVLEC